jgi:large subunit ribosomal protein L10
MPNIEAKQAVVEEIKNKFAESKTAVLVDYRGLNVAEVSDLRSKAREAGIDYKVYKNTMMRFAVKELGYDELLEHLVGPTAVAFCNESEVAASKVMYEFGKDNEALEIKAGLVDGTVMDVAGIKAVAGLPSKEILVAKALGGLNAPIAGFANVLNANIKGLAVALGAIMEQKQAEA